LFDEIAFSKPNDALYNSILLEYNVLSDIICQWRHMHVILLCGPSAVLLIVAKQCYIESPVAVVVYRNIIMGVISNDVGPICLYAVCTVMYFDIEMCIRRPKPVFDLNFLHCFLYCIRRWLT